MKKILSTYYLVGKYSLNDKIFDDYIKSFREYFCLDCDLTFLLVTDRPDIYKKYEKYNDIIIEYVDLMDDIDLAKRRKFHYIYINNEELLKQFDYIHYANSNLRCNKAIFLNDIIKDNEFTVFDHPWDPANRERLIDSFQQNPNATIYMESINGVLYYQAASFITTSDKFIQMAKKIISMTEVDENNEIYALWHDETYFNFYISKIIGADKIDILSGQLWLYQFSDIPPKCAYMHLIHKSEYISDFKNRLDII